MSFHQPLTMCELDPAIGLDQGVDRVGDLELPATGGLDRMGGLEDRRREHVDADQGHVAGRVLRLLDQPHDALAIQLGDAVGGGIVDAREQDQGVGLGAAEDLDQVGDAVAEQVVAEVHDERALPQELLGREQGVGESERGLLLDVGDPRAELGAVARGLPDLLTGLRGDDHADLDDPRLDQRLDPVEEHGLVRHRHELLGGGVRDRAQASPGTPGEDQPLQIFHERVRLTTRPRKPSSARTGEDAAMRRFAAAYGFETFLWLECSQCRPRGSILSLRRKSPLPSPQEMNVSLIPSRVCRVSRPRPPL